jgi:hypothetical protein
MLNKHEYRLRIDEFSGYREVWYTKELLGTKGDRKRFYLRSPNSLPFCARCFSISALCSNSFSSWILYNVKCTVCDF